MYKKTQALSVYAQGQQNEQLTELNILASASMLLTMRFYCLRVDAKPVGDIECSSDFKLLIAFHFQKKSLYYCLSVVCIKTTGIYFRALFIVSRTF